MKTAKLSPTERQTFWSNHIEQWGQSGLSRTAYCKHAAINLNQLCYWINKRDGKSPRKQTPNFIPVTAKKQTSVMAACEFKFVFVCGAILQWHGEADPGYIQKLVMGLGQ